MFGSARKITHMKSPEEQEIFRLESRVTELSASLANEKTKSTIAATEAGNQKSHFIAQGRKLERERILKIRSLPEFAGRETLALKMALSDAIGSSPESINIMLKNSPKKETGKSQFEKYMEALGNPSIGADFDQESHDQNTNILESIAKGVL